MHKIIEKRKQETHKMQQKIADYFQKIKVQTKMIA